MSMVSRLPNSHEILISLFPVLSLAQESGNAQAHYNMSDENFISNVPDPVNPARIALSPWPVASLPVAASSE